MSSPPPQYEYFSNHPFQIVPIKPLQGSYPAQGYYLPTGSYPQQNACQQHYHQPSSAHSAEQQADPAVAAGQVSIVKSDPPGASVDFTGATILSCITIWTCGFLLGIIAYILATTGRSRSDYGDYDGARRFLYWSYSLSIVGLVLGVTAIGVSIYFSVVNNSGFSGNQFVYG